jgi:hypothetical protein
VCRVRAYFHAGGGRVPPWREASNGDVETRCSIVLTFRTHCLDNERAGLDPEF